MAQPKVYEGTWEELKLLEHELAGKRFRLLPLPLEGEKTPSKSRKSRKNEVQPRGPQSPRKLTGMGKFAGILPSSEEFMRLKQEEIELEERKLQK
jgi:hypothetical protein